MLENESKNENENGRFLGTLLINLLHKNTLKNRSLVAIRLGKRDLMEKDLEGSKE